MQDLTIEEAFRDRCYTTYIINGFSPDEVSKILDGGREVLCNLLVKHGYANTAITWHNGYGIYEIRHCGGHLLVKTGSSCD